MSQWYFHWFFCSNSVDFMNLVQLASNIKKFFLDLLFPIECLGCGLDGVWVCDSCLNTIGLNLDNQCVVCSRPCFNGLTHGECRHKNLLDQVIFCADSNSKLLHQIIYRFKYNFIQELKYPLGEIMINKIIYEKQQGNDLFFGDNLVLVPVPLHKKRLKWRGFNQAALLACQLADFLEVDSREDILFRRKYNKPQVKLNRKTRLENLKNSFAVNPDFRHSYSFKNCSFLLVDDILTTGVTLSECARILKQAGARRVAAIVLCRG